MQKVARVFEYTDKVLFGISCFTMFAMMIWIFIDVMLRAFFNSPLTGELLNSNL